jgi:hypothetical protein
MVGTVVGFTSLPSAASDGLKKATEASGKTVPVRAVGNHVPTVAAPVAANVQAPTTTLPVAATHGSAVSKAARATDTTPATNHGADVSIVAQTNHGQTVAATHKPAGTGKPVGAGKPSDPGKPADPGPPAGAGRP